MKRPFSLFVLLGMLLAACGQVEPTATPFSPTLAAPTARAAMPTLAVATPAVTPLIPTAAPTWTPPPLPTTAVLMPPSLVNNHFQNLRFAANPGAAPQGVFPVGTAEVFAVWEYSGMNDGDFVQRAWRYNGDSWLNKEEVWDTAVRGASGTITDVSIYGEVIGGLAPGEYQLDLFVNGGWQTGGSFTVLPRPEAGEPVFSKLHFAAGPNTSAQTNFAAGIPRVYAIWNYHNMGVSDVVKREWTLNGAVWLAREDTWDYFHYGPDGMVTDVSIYDFESGLPSGSYTMAVYLNGVKQLEGAFVIGE